MKVTPTALPEVLILEPRVFEDTRGHFFEAANEAAFAAATGVAVHFVQDNLSGSRRGVIRGLHYQLGKPQGKLVRAVAGSIWDVAVDVRRASPRFGQWTAVELSAQNRRALWVPVGFAHGFLVLSDFAEVIYKVSDYYSPADERTIRWDDPAIGVAWPLDGEPILSPRDAEAPSLATVETFP